MDLRHLRYFVAVAETGAFARAAARLHITQPALWRQVHSLEVELGVRLFERAGRRVRMTSAGEALLLRSRELLAGAEQLVEHARAVRGGEVGSLSIAASPQVIQNVLAPFLTRYLKSRPRVDVQLIEEGAARALELVERGEAHLAVAIRRGNDRLDGRPVFPFRVLAAMSSDDALARRRTVDITDFQGRRVLLLRHGFGARELFEAARGIAIVPSTVGLMGRKVRVAPVLHAGASMGMWGWIVWDPKRFLPAFAKSFIDGFVEYNRRNYPGRQFERRAPPVPRP